MQAKPKSNSVVTTAWDLATGILTITVLGMKDGIIAFNVRDAVGPVAYDGLNDLGKRGLMHGMNQRIPDRAAIGRDKTTGSSASPEEKFAAMKALADHYKNGGAWELAGGGLPPVNRGALYQAVAFVRGIDAVKIEATYRDKTDEVLRTLLTIPQIAGKYTELSRATAVVNPEADKLLAELKAMEETKPPVQETEPTKPVEPARKSK